MTPPIGCFWALIRNSLLSKRMASRVNSFSRQLGQSQCSSQSWELRFVFAQYQTVEPLGHREGDRLSHRLRVPEPRVEDHQQDREQREEDQRQHEAQQRDLVGQVDALHGGVVPGRSAAGRSAAAANHSQ